MQRNSCAFIFLFGEKASSLQQENNNSTNPEICTDEGKNRWSVRIACSVFIVFCARCLVDFETYKLQSGVIYVLFNKNNANKKLISCEMCNYFLPLCHNITKIWNLSLPQGERHF